MLTTLTMLAFANIVTNRFLPNWAYVPWNVGVGVGIIWVARHEVTLTEMGFTRWRRGLQWGAALFGITGLVLLVGLALPLTHDMFHDKRVAASEWAWFYHSMIRIPLGTAFLEETAFRAVLPALLAVRWGVVRGCVGASALFGLWHVLPSLGLHRVNPTITNLVGTGAGSTVMTVLLAVCGTSATGLLWCWMRYRSGSILATMLGHVATNSIAYTIAFWIAP